VPDLPPADRGVVARACKAIAIAIGKGASAACSATPTENVQGEVQKKLDVLANEILLEANEWGGHLAAMASEEMDDPHAIPQPLSEGRIPAAVRSARRLVEHRRERLDRHHLLGAACPEASPNRRARSDFLQPGTQQVAPAMRSTVRATQLVLTVGDGTHMLHARPRTGSSC
jgi:fructose-1,6-bisphosphatase I